MKLKTKVIYIKGGFFLKKILIVVLGIVIVFFLSSCLNKPSKVVKIKEVRSNQDSRLEEILLELQLQDDGVYSLEKNKHKYIIFNGTEKLYENIDYELNGANLKIKFKTGTLYKIRQVVYEVYPFPSDIYDTITLEQNGEETIFKGIYVN